MLLLFYYYFMLFINDWKLKHTTYMFPLLTYMSIEKDGRTYT